MVYVCVSISQKQIKIHFNTVGFELMSEPLIYGSHV